MGYGCLTWKHWKNRSHNSQEHHHIDFINPLQFFSHLRFALPTAVRERQCRRRRISRMCFRWISCPSFSAVWSASPSLTNVSFLLVSLFLLSGFLHCRVLFMDLGFSWFWMRIYGNCSLIVRKNWWACQRSHIFWLAKGICLCSWKTITMMLE